MYCILIQKLKVDEPFNFKKPISITVYNAESNSDFYFNNYSFCIECIIYIYNLNFNNYFNLIINPNALGY